MNITTPTLTSAFEKNGFRVIPYNMQCDDYDKCRDELIHILDSSYYGVFMYDYIPQMAEACYIKKVLYIAWIVDSPCFALYSDTVTFETNRLFSFEKKQVEFVKKQYDIDMIYQPLGTDVTFFINKIKKKDSLSSDVSFVGNLYNSPDRNLYLSIKYLPDYIRGYISGIIAFQSNMEQNIIVPDLITEEIEEGFKKYVNFDADTYDIEYVREIISLIQKESTRIERCNASSLLSRLFDFKLYSGSDISFDKEIKRGRYLDYQNELPIVFYNSRINLNITLKSIETAIPLRALDIMACHGFLLSDYQDDLAYFFDDGVECAMYYSPEDMVQKVDFYLKHEDLRNRISQAGYEKVKNCFSLEKIIGDICDKLNRW